MNAEDTRPPADQTRAYWRSLIVDEMVLRYGMGFEQFDHMVARYRATLGEAMLGLLDLLCDQERDAGYRTKPMQVFCSRQCERIFKEYSQLTQRAA